MILKCVTRYIKNFFFQPNHFFLKNKISQKNISYVIFNFSVYHPPLGQPWDFTCTFVPMVGISLQFWSLGWGPSLVYTTQPVGLHGNILSPPPGAPGGGGRRKNWIPHYWVRYPGDTLRHLKYEGRIVEKRFKDPFSFIFWRGTRFSYLERTYGRVSARKWRSNISYFQSP